MTAFKEWFRKYLAKKRDTRHLGPLEAEEVWNDAVQFCSDEVRTHWDNKWKKVSQYEQACRSAQTLLKHKEVE